MRIGMVTACFEPVINGVTRMVSLYKRQLEEEGHQVTVFTLGIESQNDFERGIVRSPAFPLGRSGYHIAARYSRPAREAMSRMDILHCHHPLMGLEMAHRYGRCPVVFTNHTRYDIYLSAYSPLTQSASEMLLRRFWPTLTDYADIVIAPSPSVQELLLSVGVLRPVEVIVNGIDLSAFHFQAAQRSTQAESSSKEFVRIIYVGRLSAEKNVITLIHEFSSACRVNPHLHLTMVGDGQQRRRIEQLVNGLGLGSRVVLEGEVDPAGVPRLLAGADIFATCSVSEVHPLTIIEAMAAGLPVVATNSPGIKDIVVDGETGLLGQDEEGEISKRLVALSMDPSRMRLMGATAFRASSQFSIQNTVSRTIALYERLLLERPDVERRNAHWRNRAQQRAVSWQARLPNTVRTRTRRNRDE